MITKPNFFAVVFTSLVAVSCRGGGDDGGSSAVYGPPGGMLEVDAGEMRAGGGTGGSASSGGDGGSSATGGIAGVGASAGSSGSSGAGGSGGVVVPEKAQIGDTCETDADCESPLFCRQDSVDYSGHKQCTTSCIDSAACATYSSGSFCNSAGFCVLGCSTFAD